MSAKVRDARSHLEHYGTANSSDSDRSGPDSPRTQARIVMEEVCRQWEAITEMPESGEIHVSSQPPSASETEDEEAMKTASLCGAFRPGSSYAEHVNCKGKACRRGVKIDVTRNESKNYVADGKIIAGKSRAYKDKKFRKDAPHREAARNSKRVSCAAATGASVAAALIGTLPILVVPMI